MKTLHLLHRSKKLGMCSNSIDPLIEIGGYFGLDLPNYGDPFSHTLKFQSGRAALRAVLECAGIRRVFLPVYICDAVVQAIIDSGAVVEPYVLNDSLYPKSLPSSLPEECVVLYVNYFGLCDENVERLLQEVPKKQLIIDNSQALFASPGNALATIYSPRKYIGVPDGGLLVSTELDIKMPENEDADSLGRMKPLLLRMSYSARIGYLSYVESEKTLNNTKPLKMSHLTNRLMASVNMDAVKKRRRENFLTLAAQLDKFNEYKWLLGSDSVPLCYPLLIGRNIDYLKEKLIEKGTFIPTYWPEVKSRAEVNSLEYRLLHNCLFIPCDHRYSVSQMNVLAREITVGFEGKSE